MAIRPNHDERIKEKMKKNNTITSISQWLTTDSSNDDEEIAGKQPSINNPLSHYKRINFITNRLNIKSLIRDSSIKTFMRL